ncbi:Hypothetical protein EIN_179400, partial [Entamoeba invadens IP1]
GLLHNIIKGIGF